jgi:hypothetical protein
VKGRRYVFGNDGLLKRSSVECGPMGGWPNGKTTDADWRFEKKGERYMIVSIKFSGGVPGDDRGSSFSYYDGPDGSALLQQITFSPSQGTGEADIRLHDYVIDGKLVESTEAHDGKTGPEEKPAVPKTDK